MNMLGIRQPEIYGHATYEDLKSMIEGEAERLGAEVSFFQSNHEGALVRITCGEDGEHVRADDHDQAADNKAGNHHNCGAGCVS